MRNENLELAQSSGSESSPSWTGTNTPKASTFNFEFSGQSQTPSTAITASTTASTSTVPITATGAVVDELATQFKVKLKPSRSTDNVLGAALQEAATSRATLGGGGRGTEGDVFVTDDGGGGGSNNEGVKSPPKASSVSYSLEEEEKSGPTFTSQLTSNKVALFPTSSSSQKSKSFNYGDVGMDRGGSVGGAGGGREFDTSSSSGGGSTGFGGGAESSAGKRLGKESKIARFLRRTQSANEDSTATMMMKSIGVGDVSKAEVEGAQQQHSHLHSHSHHQHASPHSSKDHHHHHQHHHLHHLHQQQSLQQPANVTQKIGDDTTTTSGGGGGGAEEGRGCSSAQSSAARSKRHKFASVGTDMKFRLGFLKRRHTEGTIHSASVRPPPEEAQKWANSFNDLMASKYGQALFKAFLQREFSEENIEFWLAIEDYRKSRQNKLNTKAQKIYNDFIIPQAPKEVNLDSLTKDSLVTKMAQPTHSTFDQAQKRIQGLLEADAYSRFLKSDLYMELVHPEKYQQQQSP